MKGNQRRPHRPSQRQEDAGSSEPWSPLLSPDLSLGLRGRSPQGPSSSAPQTVFEPFFIRLCPKTSQGPLGLDTCLSGAGPRNQPKSDLKARLGPCLIGSNLETEPGLCQSGSNLETGLDLTKTERGPV